MRKLAQTMASGVLPRQAGRSALATVAMAGVMAAFAIVTTIYVRHHILLAFSHLAETRDMQARTLAIQTGVIEAEAARRGFIISRDATVLTPHDAARAQIDSLIGQLEADAVDSTGLRDAARLFARSVTAAMQAIDPDIARRREKPNDPGGVTATIEAQTRIETMRAAGAALQTTLDAQLVQRRAGVYHAVTILLVAVSLLAIGLGFIIVAQTRDLLLQTAGRMRSESLASQEIAGLSDTVTRTQAELNRSHRQLDLALRSARVQVFSLAPDGSVDWVSDPESDVRCMRAAPFRLEKLAEDPERARIAAKIAATLAEGAPSQFEMRIAQAGQAGGDWLRIDIRPQSGGGAIGSAVDISVLKERESRMFWLMRELSHRSKNLLAIVQAIARQTARAAPSLGAFEQRFQARLAGMAAAHDLLVKSSYESADLEELIRSQLGPESYLVGDRIALSGPPLALRPEAAQNMALAFHELVANARTHGALATPQGSVAIAWRVEADRLLLDWIETGGASPGQKTGKGFGTSLIATNLPRSLDGEVRLTYEPAGATCHMALPLRRLLPEAAAQTTR